MRMIIHSETPAAPWNTGRCELSVLVASSDAELHERGRQGGWDTVFHVGTIAEGCDREVQDKGAFLMMFDDPVRICGFQ